MATLTAAEITYINAMTGNDCDEISTEFIQWLHDNKASTEPLCMSGDPLGSTIVWVLKARVRKATKLFDETNAEGISKTVSQKYTHLKEQLATAELECGMGGAVVTISTFDMGLDSECDDSEYASYRYRGVYWGGWL